MTNDPFADVTRALVVRRDEPKQLTVRTKRFASAYVHGAGAVGTMFAWAYLDVGHHWAAGPMAMLSVVLAPVATGVTAAGMSVDRDTE